MLKTYKVHACGTRPHAVKALVAGKEVDAQVEMTIVELVPSAEDGSGSIIVSVGPEMVGIFSVSENPDSPTLVDVTFAAHGVAVFNEA